MPFQGIDRLQDPEDEMSGKRMLIKYVATITTVDLPMVLVREIH